MDNRDQHPTQVVSLISGKGGSGKTSAALSMAKLLSEMGLKVLVVDFDFATNGAAFFYSPEFQQGKKEGLSQILARTGSDLTGTHTVGDELFGSILHIRDGFDFLPSNTRPGTTLELDSGFNIGYFQEVLKEFLKQCDDYSYVFFDNQAGYSDTSAAATSVADKVVVVSEADPISSDAVDSLMDALAKRITVPRFRRYLINKVEIREAGDYRQKVEAFRNMNRLPPLPFDFDVRNAFGERTIPIDLDNPGPFLIALFRTLKEVIPERRDLLDKYERERVTLLFDEYQRKVDDLLERRKEIQDKLITYQTLEQVKSADQRRFNYQAAAVSLAGGLTYFVADLLFNTVPIFFFAPWARSLIPAIFVLPFAIILISIVYIRYRQTKTTSELEFARIREQALLEQELRDQDGEINRYRNLISVRSSELLIDTGLTEHAH